MFVSSYIHLFNATAIMQARRFITLVDELYNHRRQMICTAATSIDELFLGSDDGHLLDLEG
jgi:predicted ATPase